MDQQRCRHPPAVASSCHQPQQSLSQRKLSSSSPAESTSRPTRIVHSASSDSGLYLPLWQRTRFIALILLMGFYLIALGIFLVLTLDFDYTASPASADSEGVQEMYSSLGKLFQNLLGHHDLLLGGTSTQQPPSRKKLIGIRKLGRRDVIIIRNSSSSSSSS